MGESAYQGASQKEGISVNPAGVLCEVKLKRS